MAGIMEGRDEERILYGWKHGDPESVRYVVRLWGPTMLRVALALCPRHEDAEEVVQDALLLAHRSLDEFDPRRGSLRTWLVGVTANRARQIRRSQNRYAGLLERLFRQPYQTASIGRVSEDLEFARKCLRELPRREREAFVLMELEDLTSEDAARVMDVAASTVRVLVARARGRLQRRAAVAMPQPLRAEGKNR